MLHILGLIGIGIGIALLCILILALILLLVVLFVPIRYRIAGNKEAERGPMGEIKIHWLFHLISGRGTWEGRIHYRIRILGIPVYDNLRKKQKEKAREEREKTKKNNKQKANKKKTENEKANKENLIKENIIKENTNKENINKENVTKEEPPKTITGNTEKQNTICKKHLTGTEAESARTDASPGEENPVDSAKSAKSVKSIKPVKRKRRRSLWSRLREKARAIWQKIMDFIRMIGRLFQKISRLPGALQEKAVRIRETIEDWKTFLEREDLKRALLLCKKQLLKVWKNIRPRKVKADIRFGLADPSGTGQVLAVAGMLYPILGKTIVLRPDFEEQVLEGHILIKGRVTIFILLKALWILYFNKDIKWLIRIWKKEETLHGRS